MFYGAAIKKRGFDVCTVIIYYITKRLLRDLYVNMELDFFYLQSFWLFPKSAFSLQFIGRFELLIFSTLNVFFISL